MDRQAFREAVFNRDGGRCVFCKEPAVDAHHLIERRLWKDGGYVPDNGIAVCANCHLACEQTIFSVEEGREAAGITNVVVPEHMYADHAYDKWGNVVLADGTRARGELFYDPSVQKVLAAGGVLDLFTSKWFKYPRTYHLKHSNPGKDDRTLTSYRALAGQPVVVTEKMDGENTTIYSNKVHARSIDGRSHPSQGWVRQFAAGFQHEIPDGMRVCGENLYARHSIGYTDLPSYFLGFSVWEDDVCLDWDATLDWFALLGITPVPVLWEGEFSEAALKSIALDESRQEGYVVRLRDSFTLGEFAASTAKYVRADHVRTAHRWDRNVVPNKLAKGA